MNDDGLFEAPTAARTWSITEPGWYEGMTDVEYHADPVAGGSVSSTGARLLVTKTPAHFAWNRDHRDDEDEKPSKDLDFGKVAHARVLGRGTDVAVIVGTGKDRNAWRTDVDKANVAKARAAGKTPIRYRDHQVIERMAAQLREHPTAGPLLARPGRHEQVGVWRDPVTGVWCRFMGDFLPDPVAGGRRTIVDYKTARDASPAGFAKAMAEHGYDQQGDWYETGVDALDPRPVPAQFVLVAQEKTAPYLVGVFYLDETARARGRARNEQARELYRACAEAGQWPGYSDDPVELHLPPWAAREFETQQEIAAQYGEAYA